jgi:hypothetical protein
MAERQHLLMGRLASSLFDPQQISRMMQCLLFVGLGSGDEDGSGLADDPVGVLVAALSVAPGGAGLAVRVCAPCGCR